MQTLKLTKLSLVLEPPGAADEAIYLGNNGRRAITIWCDYPEKPYHEVLAHLDVNEVVELRPVDGRWVAHQRRQRAVTIEGDDIT
jgi:hypothetical protein